MTGKLRKSISRIRLVSGFGLVSMCAYYGLAHRYTVFIPWLLCFVCFMLWQLQIGKGEETTAKRKVRRY